MLIEEHNVVKVVSERIFAERKRKRESETKNMKKEIIEQDVKEQSEKETASTNKVFDEQKPKPKLETEEKSQAQNADKVITNELTRQRKSITRAQSSTKFASSKKSKKNRVINSVENFNDKRQRKFMIADVKKFKKKTFLFFSNKQHSFQKIFINQKTFTRSFRNDAQSTTLQ